MILNVRPSSQLSPIPMIMGCEGTAASMLLEHNGVYISKNFDRQDAKTRERS